MTTKGHVLVLVPNKAIGAVIGKGGATIRDVSDLSKAKMTVKPRDSEGTTRNERILVIEGTIDQCVLAFSTVFEKAEVAMQAPDAPEHADTPADTAPQPWEGSAAVAATSASSPPSALSLRLLLRNDMIGYIIGKGGATIKRLGTESATTIKINTPELYPGQQTMRIVTCEGPANALADALRKIMTLLDEYSQEHAENQASLYSGAFPSIAPQPGRGGQGRHERNIVMVPEAMVGSIIGRGGINAKSITECSGAKIHVETKEEKDARISAEEGEEKSGDDRQVVVMGTTEQQYKAQRRIYELLSAEDERKETRRAYKMKVHFAVSVAMLGSVIGKGGAKIKEISTMSGAKLNLLRWVDEKPEDDVVVEVVGIFEETQAAQNLIRQVVFDQRLRSLSK